MKKINLKDRKVIFFAALWATSLILIVVVQVMSNRNIQDNKTSDNVSRINSLLQDSYYDKGSFPRSLDGLRSDSSYDDGYYDDIDTSKVTYTRVADNGYKICTTYKNERLSYKGEKGSQTMKLSEYGEVPEEHPKGNVCYTYTAEDEPYNYDYDYRENKSTVYDTQNSAAGVTCAATVAKQAASPYARITQIDDTRSVVTIGTEQYTLCTNMTIYDKSGKAVGDSTLDLEIGDTVSMVGADKGHISIVNIQ